METERDLRSVVEGWIEAWNCRDLDRIMRHYASSVVFEANTVVRRWNRPDGTLRGADEFREQFRIGLELAPCSTLSWERCSPSRADMLRCIEGTTVTGYWMSWNWTAPATPFP